MSNTDLVPITAEPTSLAQVHDICAQIERWAETTDDVAALRDNAHKLTAINEYLARTTKDGQARVYATLRRLDIRVGQLLSDEPGQRTDLEPLQRAEKVDIRVTTKSHLRTLSKHPEVVEEVIEQSTDEDPATRRKVLRAIEAKTKAKAEDPASTYDAKDKSRAAVAWRREQIAAMAAEGLSGPQIAEVLGIRNDTVTHLVQELGIELGVNRDPERKYDGKDKRRVAVAWRRERIAAAAAEGRLFSSQVAEMLGISAEAVRRIASEELGVEFKVDKLMWRRRARIDLDEYVVTMAEGLASSVDRAFDMVDDAWDQLDPEARARAEAVLTEVIPRLTRLRKALTGDLPPPLPDVHGVGAARWVTVEDDTWRDFRVATRAAGDKPGSVLGRAVEQYNKEHS